jgi:hypothetical protein
LQLYHIVGAKAVERPAGGGYNPRQKVCGAIAMTTFNDREKAFENLFEHDQELQFKARARRNKLLGLWVAGQLGKTGEAAEKYARDIVLAAIDKPGQHGIVHTLMHDLAAAGKHVEEHTINRQGERFFLEAKKQLMTEVK